MDAVVLFVAPQLALSWLGVALINTGLHGQHVSWSAFLAALALVDLVALSLWRTLRALRSLQWVREVGAVLLLFAAVVLPAVVVIGNNRRHAGASGYLVLLPLLFGVELCLVWLAYDLAGVGRRRQRQGRRWWR